MTEREAVKELQVGYLGDTEEIVQAKHIAISALEKQIAKKLIRKAGDTFSSCPTCGSYFYNDYCGCCGQKIDKLG